MSDWCQSIPYLCHFDARFGTILFHGVQSAHCTAQFLTSFSWQPPARPMSHLPCRSFKISLPPERDREISRQFHHCHKVVHHNHSEKKWERALKHEEWKADRGRVKIASDKTVDTVWFRQVGVEEQNKWKQDRWTPTLVGASVDAFMGRFVGGPSKAKSEDQLSTPTPNPRFP